LNSLIEFAFGSDLCIEMESGIQLTASAYLHDSNVLRYRFSDSHPFNQQRLLLTNELLFCAGALTKEEIIQPKASVEPALLSVHTKEYVSIVKALSASPPLPEAVQQAQRFGLGDGDTPYFPGMHEATLSIVAGSLSAAELVMSGTKKRALNLSGGLHHAFNYKAAGFCVYNDASIAIRHIRDKYNVKVLYIDTDVHHGDGVQATYYTDPSVCTFSIHETGKYLFPGTGFAGERGESEGFGYCFNLPVEPFTEDESWIDNFRDAIERTTAFFQPDIIVSQHGCDAHYFDPLSHQHCSMAIYMEMPLIIKRLADTYCQGRWIALGGGGYDIWRVVPRAWSLLWLVMSEHPLIERLQQENVPLPMDWVNAHKANSPTPLPTHWLDNRNDWDSVPRRQEIDEKNKQNKELALLYLPDSPFSQE